jgi:CRP-like cAMP-binding protein
MSAGALAAAAAAARTGNARPEREWAAVLEQLPLFAELSRRHVRRVASLARVRRFEPRTAIVEKGQTGHAFYVILDGKARVAPKSRKPLTLRAGDFFGELALLDGGPRTATVEADGEVLTLEIGHAGFARLLRQEPQLTLALLKTLAGRLRERE